MLSGIAKVFFEPRDRVRSLSFCVAIVLAAALVDGWQSNVHAGTLRGRVTLSGSPAESVQQSSFDPYPGTLGSLPQTGHHDTATPRDVVIYLTGAASATAGQPGGDKPKLYQFQQNFEPHVLGIPTGTTVEFPNKDLIFHNVFSYSKTKRFDLGYYGRGKSKSVVFDKPGLVKVFCDIHSNMSAFILVVDTPHVVQPEQNGEFEIADIPDGEYALHIWHPTRGSRTQKVSIEGGTTEIDINL